MHRLVIGTAGHVDHGKTTLVSALTDVWTDRLPEEQRRGMSIELGFAPLRFEDGRTICFVDVPGHEQFIETMIRGAWGVGAVLLTVAADEGIRPQTLEHISILSHLQVPQWIVALTKSDLSAPDELAARTSEIRSELKLMRIQPRAILPTSAKTGSGISELKNNLKALLDESAPNLPKSPFRFPIDRVFSKPGFGTIVTGTLKEGTLRVGESVEVLFNRRSGTVRALQVFGESVSEISGPARLAINLSGLDKGDLSRDDLLIRGRECAPTRRVHGRWMPDQDSVKSRHSNVSAFHLGQKKAVRLTLRLTTECDPLCELRFSDKNPLICGDTLLIRSESPSQILGSVIVVDPIPTQRLREVNPKALLSHQPSDRLAAWVSAAPRSLTTEELARRLGRELGGSLSVPGVAVGTDRWASPLLIDEWKRKLLTMVTNTPGIRSGQVSSQLPFSRDANIFRHILQDLKTTGRILEKVQALFPPGEANVDLDDIVRAVVNGNGAPPDIRELMKLFQQEESAIRRSLQLGLNMGVLVRVSSDLYFSSEFIRIGRELLETHFLKEKSLDIQGWKALIGTSRKYAVPLLEYFDQSRMTVCRPDRIRIAGPRLSMKE